jgi:hypothetical protein
MTNSLDEVEQLYGQVIAVQDNIYWTNKNIVIWHNNIMTVISRNPPENALVQIRIKDVPGQQTLF